MEVSLQLYSINEETKKDFKESIKTVAKIGYKGVEFAGYGSLSADDMKTLLKENNLYPVGAHCNIADSLDKEIEFNHAIGSSYLICPYAKLDTRQEVDQLVKVLNEAAKKAEKYNLKVGYHNHAHEFKMLDGKYIMDIIAENTTDEVILELDVFWIAYAGVDPVEYIKKWGKKVELIHLKQIDEKKANVDMVDGSIDMKQIKEAASYAKYFVVEHEEYDKPVWDAIKNDFDYLDVVK